jgi:hypothetical protein
MKPIFVAAAISKESLVMAILTATVHDQEFDAREWSIRDAEVLEAAARMIREGYARKERAS